ncbi:SPW repeat protein [Mucilaginibacter sp. HD30]
MKFINRKTHAVLDYLIGIVLITSPWIFGFAAIPEAKWTAVIIGIILLLTAMMTDYEGGIVKSLSMKTHLNLDAVAGILLAISPWVIGFNDRIYLPHLLVGILEIGAAIFTQNRSQHAQVSRNVKRQSF